MKTLHTMNQKGATLLELTMAVGIIAVIAIAAISFFQGASESSKSQEAIRNVGALTASVRNQYQAQGSYLGLDNTQVKATNGFPTAMDPDLVPGASSDIKHPWNNAGVIVLPHTFFAGDDGIEIELQEVPQGPCIDIASKSFRDYEEVLVNGTVATDIAQIITDCSDLVSNQLIFHTR